MSKKKKNSLNTVIEGIIPSYLKTDGSKGQIIKENKNGKNTLIELELCIENICKTLLFNCYEYNPQTTITKIEDYLEQKDDGRILYSRISGFLFELEDNKEGLFSTNISKLVEYSFDEQNNINTDVKNEILRIYDHFLLVTYQKNNVVNILKNGLEKTKDEIKENVTEEAKQDVKKYEKEYITILGIFAAIVIAFVGGMTFSTSVLENIHMVSIYRLVLIVILIAFALTNAMYLLVRFIGKINEKPIDAKPLVVLDCIYGLLFLLIISAWIIDFHSLVDYLRNNFCWNNDANQTSIPEVTTESVKAFISLIF